jgi:hypothetical protein
MIGQSISKWHYFNFLQRFQLAPPNWPVELTDCGIRIALLTAVPGLQCDQSGQDHQRTEVQ